MSYAFAWAKVTVPEDSSPLEYKSPETSEHGVLSVFFWAFIAISTSLTAHSPNLCHAQEVDATTAQLQQLHTARQSH